MNSELLYCSLTVCEKILYKGRGKNHILLLHFSLLWNTPSEVDHQHCLHRDYTETSLWSTQCLTTQTDRTSSALPSLSLSDDNTIKWQSFQDTHIHIAYWKFLITRKGCSPCIMATVGFSMFTFFPVLGPSVFKFNSRLSPFLVHQLEF